MTPGSRIPKPLRRARALVLGSALALTVVGIAFVHSTTADEEPFPSKSAKLQMGKALVALVGLFLATRLDYRWLEKRAYGIYGLLAAVLLGMLGVKIASGGVNRFINLYVFQVQPSELMKIGLVLALSRYLRFREDQRQVLGLLTPFLIMLIPMALVLLQPNLGLSLMFPPVLVAILFVAGAKPRHLAIAVTFAVLLLPAAYYLNDVVPLLAPYQRTRIESFFVRDGAAQRNESFQLRQSIIAVGSGGITGEGYLEGTQNVLKHLPEKQTDFIFSIVAEELGFVGAVGVLALYLALLWGILRVATYTREPFGRLVAAGLAVAFGVQAIENIGMTLGLTPITGIALPFVSLAGSNLVASHIAIGIVLSIATRHVRVVATRDLSPQERKRLHLVHDDKAAGLLSTRWAVD